MQKLFINALKINVMTNKGKFGNTIIFHKGLNIIRANNSSGKSTCLNSILYALGFEILLGKKGTEALTPVLKEQLISFRRQLEFASARGLPVVIHSREAFPEVFEVLKEFKGSSLNGVFHAFSGSIMDAERAIDLGFKLGIGGIVTFKNSGLDNVVRAIGPEHIVLETDSPYLAPAPHRGTRNESSYICIINKKLSDIFGIKEEDAASIVYSNSVSLFNL